MVTAIEAMRATRSQSGLFGAVFLRVRIEKIALGANLDTERIPKIVHSKGLKIVGEMG